jgi:pyridoxal phosphate enzyme (YggS family)
MTLAERYAQALGNIDAAARRSGRSGADVTLIVVSKNHPAETVLELAALGARDFGENRDQEASRKAAEVSDQVQLNWHFVGQLQTNKVKSMLSYTSALHSLDRESLLIELGKRLDQRELDCFIELNLTEDPARGGVLPQNLELLATQVLAEPRIRLRGLMAVAGLDREPAAEFERVLAAREQLLRLAPAAGELSIGMSADYEIAIEMGATHVRIGTAITGSRPVLT